MSLKIIMVWRRQIQRTVRWKVLFVAGIVVKFLTGSMLFRYILTVSLYKNIPRISDQKLFCYKPNPFDDSNRNDNIIQTAKQSDQKNIEQLYSLFLKYYKCLIKDKELRLKLVGKFLSFRINFINKQFSCSMSSEIKKNTFWRLTSYLFGPWFDIELSWAHKDYS